MKTINLKSNGVGRYDDVSPLIITDRKLPLKIALPPVNGDFYFVAENNGSTQKLLIPSNGEITLENLTAGELSAEVKHYVKGTLVKVYKVEPLLLKEIDGNITAELEIAALDRRICANESDLTEIKGSVLENKQATEERTAEIKKNVLRANKNISALIRFAIKAYSVSPFLGGGTVDKFAEEFGFDLTDEDINLIKGEG